MYNSILKLKSWLFQFKLYWIKRRYIYNSSRSTSISTTTGYLTRKLPTDTIIVQSLNMKLGLKIDFGNH